MSIVGEVFVLESELWPQRDARDPLGIFGWRVSQVGDASSGHSKILVTVAEELRHAFVYKIYDMQITQIAGAATAVTHKFRVLTNWPNIDRQPGIQAYGSFWMASGAADTDFSSPNAGSQYQVRNADNMKELLIFDPSTQTGDMVIAEEETDNLGVGVTHSFEGYGYYWDRAVMSAPGGPRNPGTS